MWYTEQSPPGAEPHLMHLPQTWAARHNTWLLIRLPLKGVAFFFLFLFFFFHLLQNPHATHGEEQPCTMASNLVCHAECLRSCQLSACAYQRRCIRVFWGVRSLYTGSTYAHGPARPVAAGTAGPGSHQPRLEPVIVKYFHTHAYTPARMHADMHITSQDMHITPQDMHITSKDLHIASQDMHSTSQDMYITSQDMHSFSQDMHITSQDVHSFSHDMHIT